MRIAGRYDTDELPDPTIKDLKSTIEFYRKRPPMTTKMLIWAFRHCIKSDSNYVIMDCVEYLIQYWDRIAFGARELVISEILDCAENKAQWYSVLQRGGLKYTKANGWRKEGE